MEFRAFGCGAGERSKCFGRLLGAELLKIFGD